MSTIERSRREFAEKIRSIGQLRSTRLVEALATVAREQFVGPGPWLLAEVPGGHFSGPGPAPLQRPVLGRGYQRTPDADPRRLYENVLVALDPERSLNNGEPAFLARCMDVLDLAPGDRFLHLGCGVGYYTAIAALAVSPGSVLALEVDPALAERAARNLAGTSNVEVRRASEADPRDEPFDAIFINAGATEIQSPWLARLRVGGRLLVPRAVDRGAGRSRQPDADRAELARERVPRLLPAPPLPGARLHGRGPRPRPAQGIPEIWACTGSRRTSSPGMRARCAWCSAWDSGRRGSRLDT